MKGLSARTIPTLLAHTTRAPLRFGIKASIRRGHPLYRRASKSTKKLSVGIIPPFQIYNNLAQLLTDEGKYAEADPLWRRAIEIDEGLFGKDDPDVAIRYNNLAPPLSASRQVCQATAFYREAIEIDEEALGGDHPTVATLSAISRRRFRHRASMARQSRCFGEPWRYRRPALAPTTLTTLTKKNLR